MPRPQNCRRIGHVTREMRFKPAGVPCTEIDAVSMGFDELEAIRLTDLEGMYQEAAAERMGVSRPTLSRIIESARRKVALALVNGLELRIQGGTVTTDNGSGNDCPKCMRIEGNGRRCPRCRNAADGPAGAVQTRRCDGGIK
ncbi:MAG TPA: DUF134 domain-containing protein [Myxococcota bacterium]|nr:DUF134 domain-containing protein [Myxococcota bacterium]HOH77666.1 DUF134 domain-containing protein [Myxococcota bacterium]HPV04002.1 DUF134 domain-containing protein [Myxococcota bacterium]